MGRSITDQMSQMSSQKAGRMRQERKTAAGKAMQTSYLLLRKSSQHLQKGFPRTSLNQRQHRHTKSIF